jgi:hypothetical protein
VGADGVEAVVSGKNLRPAGVFRGGGLVVDGGDGGLQLVVPAPLLPQGCGDQCGAFGDEVLVPAGAVLAFEGDEFAARSGTGGAAGFGEEHEAEQPAVSDSLGRAVCRVRVRRIASSVRSVVRLLDRWWRRSPR